LFDKKVVSLFWTNENYLTYKNVKV